MTLPTIAVIGAGIMGEALMKGLLRQSLIEPQHIIGADPWHERLESLEAQYHIRTSADNATAVQEAEIVFLSVKPQVIEGVLDEIRGAMRPEALVFSIAAGVRIDTLRQGLGIESIIRAMPNTPAQIGQGITVWTATAAVTGAQREHALTILRALGEEVYVGDEHYLDMATALSGTGPAYVYLFMEALVDAGVHLGFSRHIAQKLVFQTVIGSANFARQSDMHLAALRNQVTSPGGTTAEALYHLDKGGFRTVLSRAIWAAYVRSVELGRDKM
ncbi:MAG TPA: pyrroline-5-carboxylate reductase [Anaerolineae bacterium]|nr:pyrroline-5-carboxylate reductase [Anaerolineae bacterium]HQH39267.1 pyrroline-5-carboxylate reductase [Anaerolineae bacterium]